MCKILSRNIIIYLLSHAMSEMINLHNLQNMIWTNLYQEILSSSTNIRDKSVKWYVNKTYHTIKCFVIQHNKNDWNTKWHTNITHMWQSITTIVILTFHIGKWSTLLSKVLIFFCHNMKNNILHKMMIMYKSHINHEIHWYI